MKQEEWVEQVLNNPQNPTKKIQLKQQNYALYHKGIYGNKPLTWNTKEEVYSSTWKGKITLRDLQGTNRGNNKAPLPHYNIPQENIERIIEELKKQGIPEERLTFNQSMPDEQLILQGELTLIQGIYYLHYSTLRKPMRTALQQGGTTIIGLQAKLLLEQTVDEESKKDLERCLRSFATGTTDNAPTVEFSTYQTRVGEQPNRNTIIWEVRNY